MLAQIVSARDSLNTETVRELSELAAGPRLKKVLEFFVGGGRGGKTYAVYMA